MEILTHLDLTMKPSLLRVILILRYRATSGILTKDNIPQLRDACMEKRLMSTLLSMLKVFSTNIGILKNFI